MSSKLTQLKEFSNPEFVLWKAQQMGLNPVYESSRKDKKYMVFDGKKMIHFGQFKPPYEDYTKHGDEKRRDNFRKRNKKWAYARKYSPAWLSFYLLW
jgi:hypothetical protein